VGHNRCESTPLFAALGQMLPSEPGEDDASPALHGEGVLESLAHEAGLTSREAGYLEVAEEYPDLETLLRGYLAAGPIVRAMRSSGEAAVREALTAALAPLRMASGGYRIEDELRYLIATS
jgi:hypothetical protein